MLRPLNALRRGDPELGATAVEYVLMVTMIALVVITGAALLGQHLIPLFSGASNGI